MTTLVKALSFVVFTVLVKQRDTGNAAGTSISTDEVIVASLKSLNPQYGRNGTGFRLDELDMPLRRSIWEAMVGEQSMRNSRNALSNPQRLWADARIPYSLSANFFADEKRVLNQAMDEYQKYTCIRFHEANTSDKDLVSIVDTKGCSSEVGRQSGAQALSLHRSCRKIGVVLHELGHVIGLHHEHSRPDRDSYVFINVTNIPAEFRSVYEKSDRTESLDCGIPYDYWSIMHYSQSCGFQGRHVITTKDRKYQNIIGQQEGLSFRDVKRINLLYACSKRNGCPEIACPGEGFVGQDCLCWCPAPRNITSASVHCDRLESLLYVEDILKIVSNMSDKPESSDSRSTKRIDETEQRKSELQINTDFGNNKAIQYYIGEDAGYVKLALLHKTMEFFMEHTCVPLFVEVHSEKGSIGALNASGVSSFLKSYGGELLFTWARKCVTATSDGFIIKKDSPAAWEWRTIICMDAMTILHSEELSWFRPSAYWWTNAVPFLPTTVFSPWIVIIGAIVVTVLHLSVNFAIQSIYPVLSSILYLELRTFFQTLPRLSRRFRVMILKASGEAVIKPKWLLINGDDDDIHRLVLRNGNGNLEIGLAEAQEIGWIENMKIGVGGNNYIASSNVRFGAIRLVYQDQRFREEAAQPRQGHEQLNDNLPEALAAQRERNAQLDNLLETLVAHMEQNVQSCVQLTHGSGYTTISMVRQRLGIIIEKLSKWFETISLVLRMPYTWVSTLTVILAAQKEQTGRSDAPPTQSRVRRALRSVYKSFWFIIEEFNNVVAFFPQLLLIPYFWISCIIFNLVEPFIAFNSESGHSFVGEESFIAFNSAYHLFTRDRVRGITSWLGPRWCNVLIHWWRLPIFPRWLLSSKLKALYTLALMIILDMLTLEACLQVNIYLLLIIKLSVMRWPISESNYWSYSNLTGFDISFSYDSLKEYNVVHRCAEQSGCSLLIQCPDGGFVGQDCKCWCPSGDENSLPVHC